MKVQSGNLKNVAKRQALSMTPPFTTCFKNPHCNGVLQFNGSKKKL